MTIKFKYFVRKFWLSPNRKRNCLIAAIVFVVVVCSQLNSPFKCLDFLLDWKVSRLCSEYYQNEITGTLCPELCAGNSIHSFKCLAEPKSDDKIFLARKAQLDIVLQNAEHNYQYDGLTWSDNYNKKYYPTEKEYLNMINEFLLLNLNTTLTATETINLLKLKNKNNQILYHASMRSSWDLIHSNNYLFGLLFEDKEIFPKIYGTCGTFLISEYLEPLKHKAKYDLSLIDWRNHIKAAILIMDFIDELETTKPISFGFCDIEFKYFGISDNRLKYSNLNAIYPIQYIDRILSNGKSCNTDDDCSYRYCQSKCDKKLNKCINTWMNNHLQIVCERIFLGKSQRTGLLATSKAPPALGKILKRCVHPEELDDIDKNRLRGPSKELRTELYNQLTTIFENLSSA